MVPARRAQYLQQQWYDAGTKTLHFYPGRVAVNATLGGPWAGGFEYAAVRLWGATRYTRGEVTASGPGTAAGLVDVLDGNYYAGSVKFFYDEGVEYGGAFGVASGATTAGLTITADETNAQRIRMITPYWASGKPGATVKIRRDNYPANWVNSVTGYTDDPKESASRKFGEKVSSGATQQYVSLKVPRDAKPGYSYWFGFEHMNDVATLFLETPYQIATMSPSKTSIRKGTRIRVKGVIPTEGHWGSRAGKRKTVALCAHRGTASMPKAWSPGGKGWVKVASVRANGYGAYTTPYFKPLKTLTLVVRYPGDDWY